MYLRGFAFSLGLSLIWTVLLQQLNTTIYDDVKQEGFPTSFSQLHDMSMMLVTEVSIWLFLLPNIGYSLYFLREIVSAFGRLTPFLNLTKLLRRALLWTPKMISRQFGDFDMSTWAKQAGNLVTKMCPCFNAVILFASC